MKKCTVGSRHKWEFIKNVVMGTRTFHTVRVTQKGLYKCECSETKYGEYKRKSIV